MLETLEWVSSFIPGYDQHWFLHLYCQLSQFQQSFSWSWLKVEQLFLQIIGNWFPSLSGDGCSPHLQGLPPPESIEKFKRLDFGVYILLLSPLQYLQKGLRFSSNIFAKTLLTDSVVFKVGISLMSPNFFEINQLQLIDVLITSSDQIQKFLNFVHSLEYQPHILIQFRRRIIPDFDAGIGVIIEIFHFVQTIVKVVFVDPGGLREEWGDCVGQRGRLGWERKFDVLSNMELFSMGLGQLRWLRGLVLQQQRWVLFIEVDEGMLGHLFWLGTAYLRIEMRTDVLLWRLVEPNFEQSVSKVSRKRISFLNRELYPGVSVFFLHLFKYDLEYYDKFVSIQKSYHPIKISSQY